MARNRWLIALGFAAIYLIWGTTYLAISVTVNTVPPVFMVVLRGALAGGALYLWARGRGAAPICCSEIIATIPTALLLFGGGYVLVGWAEQYIASGPAALLNATTPAWVVVIEWVTRKRARPGVRVLSGLSAGVLGVFLLVNGSGGGSAAQLMPALALIAASAAWAWGTVLAGRTSHGDPLRGAALQLLTGALVLLPVSVARGEIGMLSATPATTASLLSLGYLVIFGSLIGYSAYSWLLHQVPASKVASHSYVNPLIAVVVGAVLGGERVDGSTIIAAALIIVSVAFIITEKSRGLAEVPVGSSLKMSAAKTALQRKRQAHESTPVRVDSAVRARREHGDSAASRKIRSSA